MKRIILSIVAILIISTSIAQEKVDYFQKKNEINIQIDDLFAKQSLFDFYYFVDYDYYDTPLLYYYYPEMNNSPSVGIGYKHHFSKGAIRLKGSFSMFTRSFENDKDNKDDDVFIGMYNERFSAGYEFQKNLGKTQVFFGLDAVAGFHTSVNKQKSRFTDENGYLEDYLDSKYITSSISFGAQAFIGFKYMISPQFSVSTEYHVLMEYFVSKSTLEVEGKDEEEGGKTRGFNSKLGPKGQITFSYHF